MDGCAKENKEASHVCVLGIGVELAMQWGIVRGNNIKKILSFTLEKISHISLSCKLVPVQNRKFCRETETTNTVI